MQYITESKIKQKIAIDQLNNPSALLFNQYAIRLEKLPKEIQNFVQLQISQIFFKAENPNFPPVAIAPLPRQKFFPPSSQLQFPPSQTSFYEPLQHQNSTSAPKDILSKLCDLQDIS